MGREGFEGSEKNAERKVNPRRRDDAWKFDAAWLPVARRP